MSQPSKRINPFDVPAYIISRRFELNLIACWVIAFGVLRVFVFFNQHYFPDELKAASIIYDSLYHVLGLNAQTFFVGVIIVAIMAYPFSKILNLKRAHDRIFFIIISSVFGFYPFRFF